MHKLKLLGIPFDYGQTHSGVRKSLQKLKEDGLLDILNEMIEVEDLGELILPPKRIELPGAIRHARDASIANKIINDEIEQENLTDSFLLNIGGDHGLALGVIHALLTHDKERVILWADAHGDINPPEFSPTGNFHGMPLAFLLGIAKHPSFSWLKRKLSPHKLIYFGPRDLDSKEKEIIQKLNIQYFSSEDVNRLGAKEILNQAFKVADPDGLYPIHLSFDVDVFDCQDMPATGTRVSAGPRTTEIYQMGRLLGQTGRLQSMDIVEFNPALATHIETRMASALILEFISQTLEHVFEKKNNSVYVEAQGSILASSDNPNAL